MKATHLSRPLFFLTVLSCASADAHTLGAHGASWLAGLLHPWTGADHLLAMLAVGLWAGQRRGTVRWLAPVIFPLFMAGAAWLGASGIGLPFLEPAIAGSVLVLGLLLTLRIPPVMGLFLIGASAMLHGYAHGLELPEGASAWRYGGGFLLSTTVLHALSLTMALWLNRQGALHLRLLGAGLAASGLWLLSHV